MRDELDSEYSFDDDDLDDYDLDDDDLDDYDLDDYDLDDYDLDDYDKEEEGYIQKTAMIHTLLSAVRIMLLS